MQEAGSRKGTDPGREAHALGIEQVFLYEEQKQPYDRIHADAQRKVLRPTGTACGSISMALPSQRTRAASACPTSMKWISKVLFSGATVGSVVGAAVGSVVGAVVGSVVGAVVASVEGSVVGSVVISVVTSTVGSEVASELMVISVGFVTSGAVVSTCGATQQPTTKITNAIMPRSTFFLGIILLKKV